MSSAALAPQHVPDILDCLAQLSNDEVPTPPRLASAMLDLLPDEVWSEPTYRWLDPCCKSGIFLREAARRLLEGLSEWEPDFEKRRDHIYREMLWGTSITEMTGHISRRSLYYSRDASGECSVIPFDNPAGNVPFVPAEHTFAKGRCTICGAPEDLERGDKRENYAYSFIHGAYPTEEMAEMKFDVIVGNPPYQIDDEGGHRPVPLYHRFVRQAMGMDPRYLVMITPSRWMAGGLGLSEYRAEMLKDRRIREIVDYPVASEVFPGVEVKGGVSYFLWDRDTPGQCAYAARRGNQIVGPIDRDLDEFDILVRDVRALPMLERVVERGETSFADLVASVRPFGDQLRSNFKDYSEAKSAGDLKLFVNVDGRRRVVWVDKSYLKNNEELAESWKLFLPKAASDGGQRLPNRVIGTAVLGRPGTICTETYLAIGPFPSEEAARSALSYLYTRFARFLISLRKHGQDNIPSTFAWLPQQDWTRTWTDEELFTEYEVSESEQAHIAEMVEEVETSVEVV